MTPERWDCALDPIEVYAQLRCPDRPTAFLHTPTGDGWSFALLLEPNPALDIPQLSGSMESRPEGPPLASGWFVILAYELARQFERVPRPDAASMTLPDVLAYRNRAVYSFDHRTHEWWFGGAGSPGDHLRVPSMPGTYTISGPWAEQPTRQEYRCMVERARDYIAAGDIFQVNLARWFTAEYSGDPLAYFQDLTRTNPSPYASLVELPEVPGMLPQTSFVSCSPELLCRVTGDRIETRPIAGAYPKSRAREDLPRDPKERAEHVMLVDLERNDLGRIAVPGSVVVEEMLAVEEYSHLYHIVSQVAARLRPEVTVHEILRAMFPGGTITGAPKVRAMEIIAELEPSARGIYTGSLGWIDDSGDLCLNIAIRTAVLQEGKIRVAAGAGIVADSDPEREADETRIKAAALLRE